MSSGPLSKLAAAKNSGALSATLASSTWIVELSIQLKLVPGYIDFPPLKIIIFIRPITKN
jgi:hypothetical protein